MIITVESAEYKTNVLSKDGSKRYNVCVVKGTTVKDGVVTPKNIMIFDNQQQAGALAVAKELKPGAIKNFRYDEATHRTVVAIEDPKSAGDIQSSNVPNKKQTYTKATDNSDNAIGQQVGNALKVAAETINVPISKLRTKVLEVLALGDEVKAMIKAGKVSKTAGEDEDAENDNQQKHQNDVVEYNDEIPF